MARSVPKRATDGGDRLTVAGKFTSADALAVEAGAQVRVPQGGATDRAAKRREKRRPSDGDAPDTPEPYRLYTVEELLNLPLPKPLVEDILVAGSFIVFYGQPGTAKTFTAVDIALKIALGRPWFGHAVRRGPVVYVDYEGSADIGQRVKAWLIENDVSASEFSSASFLLETVNILDEADIERLFVTIDALAVRPALLIIDTLARAMGGAEENSAKEMGRAIAVVDRLRARYGCAVILIHHTTKSGETERGSGALRAASHTMIEFWEENRVNITMHCSRQKDLRPFDDIEFDLIEIEWEGKEGKKETSCVLRRKGDDDERLPEKQEKALLALAEFPKDEGATPTEWERESGLSEGTFRRARQGLVEKSYVTKTPPRKGGGKVHVTDDGWECIEAIRAKERGGEKTRSHGASSDSRHTPPRGRHGENGGDHGSLPPPPFPLRKGGAAGKAAGTNPLANCPEQSLGTLRRVTGKRTEKSPDYSGAIDLEGLNCWLSAWHRKTKAHRNLSLRVRAKDRTSEGEGAVSLCDAKRAIWRGDLTIGGLTFELAARGIGHGPSLVLFNVGKGEGPNRS
jgi:hypothetical protein